MIKHKRTKGWLGSLSALVLLFSLALLLVMPLSAMAASTSITVTKLASDGTTVLAKRTVSYQWLMDSKNIPVTGDGTTHYYLQGPVFLDDADEAAEQALRWNPEESVNVEAKDMGAVKGTNVKDLCKLAGGMRSGDLLEIAAADGMSKLFAYKNVYQYSPREGPMVVCWYKDGKYPDSGYTDGMRLVWFADTSTNPFGIHALGNWDWHEAAKSQYWYYYRDGDEKYPTTTGLSIQNISELTIYSTQDPPSDSDDSDTPDEITELPVAAFNADVTSGYTPLTVKFTDKSTNSPTSWAWDFNNDGKVDSTTQNPSFVYTTAGNYNVTLTVKNDNGSDDQIMTNYILVSTPRLAGANRITTAIEIAHTVGDSDTVILAAADDANLADALTVAPLAGKGIPIYLTYKNHLDASVKAELSGKNVIAIGAISDAVIREVKTVATSAEKLSGADRIATNALINARLTNPAGTFLVGYDAIPDALSVASFAAANNYAIVLANPDGSVDPTKIVGSKTFIIGGPTLVKEIAGATRLYGPDRFATNLEVVKTLSFTFDKVYVANGNSLVDALVAAPLAAQTGSMILLSDNSSVYAASFVNAQLTDASKVTALGGTGVISDAILNLP